MSDNCKILLVDDETELRQTLSELVRDLGYTSIEATNPDEATALGSFEQYALIVSDYQMPKINGIEFCKTVRAQGYEGPFVMLTGYADKQIAIQALNIGITELVEKPINATGFENLVKKYGTQYITKQKEKENENQELIGFFVDETKELYSDLEETVLRLEEVPLDTLVIDSIFRKVHSVKGGASAIPGAELLAKLSHEFESRLSFIKNNKYQPSKDEIPVYTDAVALSLKLVEALKSSIHEVKTYEKAVDTIIGQIIGLPKESTTKIDDYTIPVLDKPAEHVKGLDDEHNQSFQEEEIMVKNSQLDHFMVLAGELVILKNYYQAILQDLVSCSIPAKVLSRSDNFGKSIEKATQALQDHILEVRKVPLKKISSKLSRIGRQASKQLGKKVDLEIQGAELKVDKSIATAIGASLTHMLRNSLDHGLEKPSDRLVVGKPETGKILIDIKEDKESIEVVVSDDGRGLNISKIKSKALENGIITETQAQQMTDEQLGELIFMPGFSTADQVTDVSGRGVGMDAALTMVQQLNGAIKIVSSSPKGSIFKIRIPFLQTVSVEKTLIVEADKLCLAIPIENIQQVIDGSSVKVCNMNGQYLLIQKDKNVPIYSFSQKGGAYLANDEERLKKGIVLNLKAGRNYYALSADKVMFQTEAVTQPLPNSVMQEVYIEGTTILGDDQVAYVIEPELLYNAMNGIANNYVAPTIDSSILDADGTNGAAAA